MKPDLVAHSCNSNNWEVEAEVGRLRQKNHYKFEASLVYKKQNCN